MIQQQFWALLERAAQTWAEDGTGYTRDHLQAYEAAFIRLMEESWEEQALAISDWNIWLRLKTQYQEDELGPILFIYEFEKLSSSEFDHSLNETRQFPERLNSLGA